MPGHAVEESQAPPIAVVLAWRTYLREVRAAEGDEGYERAEEQAWERLAAELERLACRT